MNSTNLFLVCGQVSKLKDKFLWHKEPVIVLTIKTIDSTPIDVTFAGDIAKKAITQVGLGSILSIKGCFSNWNLDKGRQIPFQMVEDFDVVKTDSDPMPIDYGAMNPVSESQLSSMLSAFNPATWRK